MARKVIYQQMKQVKPESLDKNKSTNATSE
jgi:hypothetical protein